MDNVDPVQGHPTPEMLEEYAFCRLSEAETERIEEHVLICEACQTSLAEVDEYIVLMKHATARFKPDSPVVPAVARWIPRKLRPATSSFALIAAMLAVCIMAALAMRSTAPDTSSERVELAALRGGVDANGSVGKNQEQINHAHAGKRLELHIDVSALPEADPYRVELVDASGRAQWKAEAAASPNFLSIQVPKKLKAGQYWVRLYSGNELQREFGLLVDQ